MKYCSLTSLRNCSVRALRVILYKTKIEKAFSIFI
jgi:hypothetical protein